MENITYYKLPEKTDLQKMNNPNCWEFRGVI